MVIALIMSLFEIGYLHGVFFLFAVRYLDCWELQEWRLPCILRDNFLILLNHVGYLSLCVVDVFGNLRCLQCVLPQVQISFDTFRRLEDKPGCSSQNFFFLIEVEK